MQTQRSGEVDKNGIVPNRINDRRSTVVDRSRRCTIGLTLNGCYIEFTVPGGPAHLSNALEKDDEVVTVDGHLVDSRNVVCTLPSCMYTNTKLQQTDMLTKIHNMRHHWKHLALGQPLTCAPNFRLDLDKDCAGGYARGFR